MTDDPTLDALDRIRLEILRQVSQMYTTGSQAQISGLVTASNGKLPILRVRLLGASCSATIAQSANSAIYAIHGNVPQAKPDNGNKADQFEEQMVAVELYDPLEAVAATRLGEIAEVLGQEQMQWHVKVVGALMNLRAAYMLQIAQTESDELTALGHHSSHDRLLDLVTRHVLDAWEKMLDLLRALKEFQANPSQAARA